MAKPKPLEKLTLKELEALAQERYGNSAFSMADRERRLEERSYKQAYIRILLRPTTAEDLIFLAEEKAWRQQIQMQVLGRVVEE